MAEADSRSTEDVRRDIATERDESRAPSRISAPASARRRISAASSR